MRHKKKMFVTKKRTGILMQLRSKKLALKKHLMSTNVADVNNSKQKLKQLN